MAKKSNKKQVKTKKVVNKATTPTEEKIQDIEVKEDAEASKVNNETKVSKQVKSEKKAVKDTKGSKSKVESKKSKKTWFRDFKAELKKVVWPSGKELFSNTAVVIIVVVVVSVLIFVLDLIFGALTKFEVTQIEKFQNKTTNSIVENITAENQTLGDNSTESGTTEVDLTPENSEE